jgi:hypothetical protein
MKLRWFRTAVVLPMIFLIPFNLDRWLRFDAARVRASRQREDQAGPDKSMQDLKKKNIGNGSNGSEVVARNMDLSPFPRAWNGGHSS